MSVRGIEPSYFAGMPTTQRDPRANQVGEGYAAMPGQALNEAANRSERKRESDQTNAFRAREQSHREEQDKSSAARDDRRLAMYQQGEDRRQTQQQFENDRLKSADTMKLVQAAQAAVKDGQRGIAEAIAAELQSRGWRGKFTGMESAPGPSAHGAAAPQDAATSRQLDVAEQSTVPKLTGVSPQTHLLGQKLRGSLSENAATGGAVRSAMGGSPAAQSAPRTSSPGDVALSSQLDQADQKYTQGLSGGQPTAMPYEQAMAMANRTGALGIKQVPGGWAPIPPGEEGDNSDTPPRPVDQIANPYRSLVPGRAMRSQVAQSDAMLSPGDPLNKIVQ